MLSRNAVLTLIGFTLVPHNGEEYLTFPGFLAHVGSSQLPHWFLASQLQHRANSLPLALLLATDATPE